MRGRGGYIGFNRVPAASAVNSAASGVWSVREAESLRRAGTWPLPVDTVAANLTKAVSGPFSTATGGGRIASPLAWSGSVTSYGLNILFTAALGGTLNLSLTWYGQSNDYGEDYFDVTRNGTVVFSDTGVNQSVVTRSNAFLVSSGDVIRLNVYGAHGDRHAVLAFSAYI